MGDPVGDAFFSIAVLICFAVLIYVFVTDELGPPHDGY